MPAGSWAELSAKCSWVLTNCCWLSTAPWAAVQGDSALQVSVLKSQLTNCPSQPGNLDGFCRALLARKPAGSQALAQLSAASAKQKPPPQMKLIRAHYQQFWLTTNPPPKGWECLSPFEHPALFYQLRRAVTRWVSSRHMFQRNTRCCIKPWPPWQKKDTEEPEGICWNTSAKGQEAEALALWGEAERMGFPRLIEKVAKWDLTAVSHYIKAAKT